MSEYEHTEEHTEARGYPLPYPTNELVKDVESLRMAIEMIRADAIACRDMVSALDKSIDSMVAELEEYAKNIPLAPFADVPDGGFTADLPPNEKDNEHYITPEYLEAYMKYIKTLKMIGGNTADGDTKNG